MLYLFFFYYSTSTTTTTPHHNNTRVSNKSQKLLAANITTTATTTTALYHKPLNMPPSGPPPRPTPPRLGTPDIPDAPAGMFSWIVCLFLYTLSTQPTDEPVNSYSSRTVVRFFHKSVFLQQHSNKLFRSTDCSVSPLVASRRSGCIELCLCNSVLNDR